MQMLFSCRWTAVMQLKCCISPKSCHVNGTWCWSDEPHRKTWWLVIFLESRDDWRKLQGHVEHPRHWLMLLWKFLKFKHNKVCKPEGVDGKKTIWECWLDVTMPLSVWSVWGVGGIEEERTSLLIIVKAAQQEVCALWQQPPLSRTQLRFINSAWWGALLLLLLVSNSGDGHRWQGAHMKRSDEWAVRYSKQQLWCWIGTVSCCTPGSS